MERLFVIAAFVATMSASAFAQTSNAPAAAPSTATNPAAPVKGANSFTEAQAKDRIEKAGYSGVSGLVKDANGVWTGKASRAGTVMTVMLDYQGNVTSK